MRKTITDYFGGLNKNMNCAFSLRWMTLRERLSLNYKKVLKNLFLNELFGFKTKFEKLVSKSYANSIVHIEKLEKEIKNKNQITNDLLASLENLTRYPNRNLVINNAVTSSRLETLPQINQLGNSFKKEKNQ